MDLCYQDRSNIFVTVFNAANGNMRNFVSEVTSELNAAYAAAQDDYAQCYKAANRTDDDSGDADYQRWCQDNADESKRYLSRLQDAMLAWGTVRSAESTLTITQYLFIVSLVMFNLSSHSQYYLRASVRDLPGVLNHVGDATVAVLQ